MEKLVEIARSFSYKLNVGNYESRDFFCSQKAECKPQDAEKVSEALYQFCKKEVVKSVNEWKASNGEVKNLEEKYASQPLKVWKPKPGEIEALMDFKVNYEATEDGGKKIINKEENTLQPK